MKFKNKIWNNSWVNSGVKIVKIQILKKLMLKVIGYFSPSLFYILKR